MTRPLFIEAVRRWVDKAKAHFSSFTVSDYCHEEFSALADAYIGFSEPVKRQCLSDEDLALIARCCNRIPKIYRRGSSLGLYPHSDIFDLIGMIDHLAALSKPNAPGAA